VLRSKSSRQTSAEPPTILPKTPPALPLQTLAPRTDERGERIFIGPGVTVRDLTDLFRDRTSIQAQHLAGTYVGKWMKVSGNLGEVMVPGSTSVQVTFDNTRATDLYMYFGIAWKERLSILKTGDLITVVGKVERISRVEVVLNTCELSTP